MPLATVTHLNQEYRIDMNQVLLFQEKIFCKVHSFFIQINCLDFKYSLFVVSVYPPICYKEGLV